MFAYSSYSGTLMISSSYYSSCVNQRIVEQFLNNMSIELTDARER